MKNRALLPSSTALVAISILLISGGLVACATQATEETCLDTGVHFELSKGLMAPQDVAKAIAATDMALADLGFTPSHDAAGRFDPITPTPPIRYVKVYDEHSFLIQKGVEIPNGPTEIYIDTYGSCGPDMQHERKKYLASIKDKIQAALQPYAAEQVSSKDATYIEID